MEPCIPYLAYLGPSGVEFLMAMLVLLILFGAKDAPRMMRKLNEIINRIRNTADGFKREVMYGDLHSRAGSYDEEGDSGYFHDHDEEPDAVSEGGEKAGGTEPAPGAGDNGEDDAAKI